MLIISIIADKENFYSKISLIEHIDEYFLNSKNYIKYISKNFDIDKNTYGSTRIVELARCDDNMTLVLEKCEYRELSKIIKNGEMIRFKNEPIILFIYRLERPKVLTETNKIGEQKQSQNQRIFDEKIIEIVGYCTDAEQEILADKLRIIEGKLEKIIQFSHKK